MRCQPHITTNARTHRKGTALIWAMTAMVAMAALSTLGVDYGRVQLVKTQLQQGVDGAALAAAQALVSGTTNVKSQAIFWAAQNTADTTPIVLQSGDITWGTWGGGTFITGGANPNAVQVMGYRTQARGTAVPLSFGGLLVTGSTHITSCNVTAKATAVYTPNTPVGNVSLNSISLSTTTYLDSYNSASYSYSSSVAQANALLQSNGTISLSGSAKINGSATPGMGDTVNITGAATVTGSTTASTSALTLATSSMPSSYTEMGAVSLVGSGTYYFTAGNYHFSSINATGSFNVVCTGGVNIYVDGPLTLNAAATITSDRPANLRIIELGTSPITLTGSTNITCDCYAPQSLVTLSGSASVTGRVQCATLTMSNSASVHYDEALNTYLGVGVSLVK